uniref:Uncharacterized protein n=1 Tax=Rhizophora mucronata TaxID=61149 RepID=A0A2P2QFT0_RHIMU
MKFRFPISILPTNLRISTNLTH